MPPRAAAAPPLPLLVLVGPAALALSFPRDLEPRSAVGLSATASYPRFGGLRGDNGSAEFGIGFQRMLRLNGTLLVAARDHLYAFALGGDPTALYPHRSVTWEPRDRAGCAVRGEVQDGCHNHIRVLLPRDARTLFVCGTNAFSPVCRTYQALTLQQEGEELPGQARCPFDARQSIAATFADDRLYSATVADFQASDAVIYRSVRGPALRSIKYSSRWLRGAWGRRGRGALRLWGRSGADGRAVPRAALRPRDAPRSARLLLLPGDGGGAGAAGEGAGVPRGPRVPQ